MGNHLVILIHLEDSVKEILFHLIYSCYVQRGSLHFYKQLKLKGEYTECLFVGELQELLIYYLQMIQ